MDLSSGRPRGALEDVRKVRRPYEPALEFDTIALAADPVEILSLVAGAMTPTVRQVRGVEVDPQTRCVHYRGPSDIVAIKMKCCGVYYACKDCHGALADHEIEVWPESEWGNEAILCGACGAVLTVLQYMRGDSRCASCGAQFNPGCRNHHHLYFEVPRAPSQVK